MRKYFLLILFLTTSHCFADTISSRRINLDSMSRAIRQQMEGIDSSIKRMDRIMDSITGKQERKLDTMAFLNLLQDNKERERHQKNMLWIKSGVLAILLILASAGWRIFRKRKRDKRLEI